MKTGILAASIAALTLPLLGGCSTPVSAPPPVIDLKVEQAEASTAAVDYVKARVNIVSETTIKYSRERMAPS